MADSSSFSGTWSPRILSVLRIVTALLFIPHGTQKLLGFPGTQQAVSSLASLMGVAGILECLGGLLLLLGVFPRSVAFLLSGQMAVAYVMAHAPRGLWPLLNGGELAALYCFVFLYLAVAGGGAWGVHRSGTVKKAGEGTGRSEIRRRPETIRNG
ncbi:MAG: DoxX family protein [Zetaproteobacteria bacterium]|nr:MAG: DoxX family protein [Zetaproteobacteria bacterium]